ncbi:MAG: hypothetical protein V3V16_00805 [Melioribacteraceae bacterium]
MKNIILIIFAVLLFSNNILGQKKYVKSETNFSKTSEVNLVKKENNIKGTISERFFTTAIIIGETILLLVIVGYWKRTRTDVKKDSKSVFKKNINALRLERVKRFDDEKLSMKRKILFSKLDSSKIDGKYITTKAKKLEISKGEIFLATRIKQLSRQAI